MITAVLRSPARLGWRRALRSACSFPGLLAIALFAQLVVLVPVADSGYWGDDTANAYVSGYLRWRGEHWWHFILHINEGQWLQFGRVLPLGVLQTYGTFDLLQDRLAYKLLLIALTLAASVMVALLVRRLGAAPEIAALAAGVLAAVWQLHLLHDPLMSYAGLMQTVTIYMCGAMLVFVTWLREGGAWRVAVVMALTLLACVTYETAYLLAAGFVLIAWRERRRSLGRSVPMAWPGLVIPAAFIVAAVVGTETLPASSGYHANLSLPTVFAAWAKIITSGLPAVGWLATPGPANVTAVGWSVPIARGVVVALLLVPLLLVAARSSNLRGWEDRRVTRSILGIAAVLILAPSLLTALAPQYQHQVEWGWGYLPMFFVSLGWSLIGAVLVGAWLRRLANRRVAASAAAVTLACVGGGLAAVDSAATARVVHYTQPSERSRSLLEASFQNGVLDQVPARGTVLWLWPEIIAPRGAWAAGEMNLEAWTREFVDRPITMHLIDPEHATAKICTDASLSPARCRVIGAPAFWLRTDVGSSMGFVAVTRIGVGQWRAGDNTMTALTRDGSRPFVYVTSPRIAARPGPLPFAVTMARPVGSTSAVDRVSVPGARLHVLRRGSGWVLAQLPPQPQFVAFTLTVVPALGQGVSTTERSSRRSSKAADDRIPSAVAAALSRLGPHGSRAPLGFGTAKRGL